jgi:hypothetical protein
VADGTLDLGTWQAVLFLDWDGPWTRTVEVLRVRGCPTRPAAVATAGDVPDFVAPVRNATGSLRIVELSEKAKRG